jgi:hypothetical protein
MIQLYDNLYQIEKVNKSIIFEHCDRSRSPTPERKPEESPEPPVRTSKPYGVPENAIALPSIAHQVQAAPPRQTIPNYSDYQDATAVRSSPNPIALTDDKPR